jgi:hypothetical protein
MGVFMSKPLHTMSITLLRVNPSTLTPVIKVLVASHKVLEALRQKTMEQSNATTPYSSKQLLLFNLLRSQSKPTGQSSGLIPEVLSQALLVAPLLIMPFY